MFFFLTKYNVEKSHKFFLHTLILALYPLELFPRRNKNEFACDPIL